MGVARFESSCVVWMAQPGSHVAALVKFVTNGRSGSSDAGHDEALPSIRVAKSTVDVDGTRRGWTRAGVRIAADGALDGEAQLRAVLVAGQRRLDRAAAVQVERAAGSRSRIGL